MLLPLSCSLLLCLLCSSPSLSLLLPPFLLPPPVLSSFRIKRFDPSLLITETPTTIETQSFVFCPEIYLENSVLHCFFFGAKGTIVLLVATGERSLLATVQWSMDGHGISGLPAAAEQVLPLRQLDPQVGGVGQLRPQCAPVIPGSASPADGCAPVQRNNSIIT